MVLIIVLELGLMALPYDAIAPGAGAPVQRSMRMRAVAAVVAIAMVACVALLGAGKHPNFHLSAC
jgi:hypothetical protein